MSRFIQFRQAWKNNDTGVIGYSFFTLERLKNGIGGVDNHTLLADDQFTGLTDKNGREIYEGDIVRHYFGVGEVRFGKFAIEIVENEAAADVQGWFVADKSEVLTEHRSLGGYAGQWEVIGNIHEDARLVK